MKHRRVYKTNHRIERECWALDSVFFKWLHDHLPVYLTQAGQIINLDYHTFTFEDKEYTQREMIVMMIHKVDKVLGGNYPNTRAGDEENEQDIADVLAMWAMICEYMWY